MVVEADESDGTFVKLPADVAVVTNIDPEHLDHFHAYDAIKAAFHSFVENVPFYGFAVMCLDHPEVQELVGQIEDRRVVTYGENPQADVRLVDVDLKGGRCRFRVVIRGLDGNGDVEIDGLELPMPGQHNALNATAAIAVADQLGISPEKIREGLSRFAGVKRRFTKTGEWQGVSINDDYGHHPVEIAAVLRAARASTEGKVIAVVQPHRYTRLHELFDDFSTCFNDADTVIVVRRLCGRRGADRRRGPRRSGRGAQGARPSRASFRSRRRKSSPPCRGPRAVGRLRRLPRRRLDHAMGVCAAGRARGARREGVSFPAPSW